MSELQFMGFIGWAAVRAWLALVVSHESRREIARVYERLRAFSCCLTCSACSFCVMGCDRGLAGAGGPERVFACVVRELYEL